MFSTIPTSPTVAVAARVSGSPEAAAPETAAPKNTAIDPRGSERGLRFPVESGYYRTELTLSKGHGWAMAIDAISDLHARWLPVADAAAVLGISDEMLRLRMSRQSIDTRVDGDGKVFVRVPYDLTDYVRDGLTTPEAPGATDTAADGNTATPESPAPETASIDRLIALYEARISDLRQVHAARIADLKAVIVELADRHSAEIERMMESHGEELQRLVGLHNTGTHNLHEQAERTAKLEADNKAMLIEIILALKGRK